MFFSFIITAYHRVLDSGLPSFQLVMADFMRISPSFKLYAKMKSRLKREKIRRVFEEERRVRLLCKGGNSTSS